MGATSVSVKYVYFNHLKPFSHPHKMIGNSYVFLKKSSLKNHKEKECYQVLAKVHFAFIYHSFSLFWLSG